MDESVQSEALVLARAEDVPSGGGMILKDQDLVLTKDADGEIHAFSATCTHLGCVVAAVVGNTINCPCHGSKFDATTGARVAGPAREPLPARPIQVRDGAIFRA